jgi:predicted DNA-binding transcriptional regulator AlpA
MNSLNSASELGSPPRYFNTKQAASYLNLSHQYLEIARHKGGGPQYIKLAKAVRYRQEDLDVWMGNHIQKHTADASLRDASPKSIDQCGHNDGPLIDDVDEKTAPPVIKVGRKKRGGENG